MVFGKKLDDESAFKRASPVAADSTPELQTSSAVQLVSTTKSPGMFNEIRGLYSSAKNSRTALICHFCFFIASFSYYVTGKLIDHKQLKKRY